MQQLLVWTREIFYLKCFSYVTLWVPIHILIFFSTVDFNGWHSKHEYLFVNFKEKDSKDRYLDYRCKNLYFWEGLLYARCGGEGKYFPHSTRTALFRPTSWAAPPHSLHPLTHHLDDPNPTFCFQKKEIPVRWTCEIDSICTGGLKWRLWVHSNKKVNQMVVAYNIQGGVLHEVPYWSRQPNRVVEEIGWVCWRTHLPLFEVDEKYLNMYLSYHVQKIHHYRSYTLPYGFPHIYEIPRSVTTSDCHVT